MSLLPISTKDSLCHQPANINFYIRSLYLKIFKERLIKLITSQFYKDLLNKWEIKTQIQSFIWCSKTKEKKKCFRKHHPQKTYINVHLLQCYSVIVEIYFPGNFLNYFVVSQAAFQANWLYTEKHLFKASSTQHIN